jgi:hypothetical protein
MRRGLVAAALAFAFAVAGCGSDSDSTGTGATDVDPSEADRVEQLLLKYTSADPAFPFGPERKPVEFTECQPADDVEYEGNPAFICKWGNDGVIAATCVARVGDRLYTSGGKLMCETPFTLRYPAER